MAIGAIPKDASRFEINCKGTNMDMLTLYQLMKDALQYFHLDFRDMHKVMCNIDAATGQLIFQYEGMRCSCTIPRINDRRAWAPNPPPAPPRPPIR